MMNCLKCQEKSPAFKFRVCPPSSEEMVTTTGKKAEKSSNMGDSKCLAYVLQDRYLSRKDSQSIIKLVDDLV